MKPKKHVILLGAGASKTSGYPDANALTVLMCDRQSFLKEFAKRLADEGVDNVSEWVRKSTVRVYYDSFSKTTQLLRAGDFATMDELSNLAQGGIRADEILKLKKLMRFVFALNDPETNSWPTSDYRALIQLLFEGKSELRGDISIISFNYDPYFEHRLLRASRSRGEIHPQPISQSAPARMSQAITSGFLYPFDSSWTKTPGFCHLKLHGTSVLPTTRGFVFELHPPKGSSLNLTTDQMFEIPTRQRLVDLSTPEVAELDPPVLLPWEIISPDGKLLDQTEFDSAVGLNWQHRPLYPLFRSIWERARDDIQAADKISFVGLSLGPFIEPELRFLFSGKEGVIQAVVANPENKKYANYSDPFHSRTPRGKVLDLFQKISPGLCCNRSDSEAGLFLAENRKTKDEVTALAPGDYRGASEITARDDFADFIQNEL
ncbi:MAG TPA: hypothetical protein VGI03_03290 [Verrucomicrobiae bacterium]|jgi:hypothetical protein